ncbi:MAG: serine/threonine-protein phosphatase [Chloroflexaceae bacterium]|nr:serine/threonine-protein phosphatase [Chloroflexaceae bacterium]
MSASSLQAHLEEAAATHTGLVRAKNEDSYGSYRLLATGTADTASRGYLYVVADGMGGHDYGDVASALAVETLCASYYNQPPVINTAHGLAAAINIANTAVYDKAQTLRRPGGRPMGTTVVCAVMHNEQLTVAHIGDSRAYLLRDGTLQPLTNDHDWATEQMQLYDLTREEARQRASEHGRRGALLRVLGVEPDVHPDIRTTDWRTNDCLLLCSDGLHGLVPDTTIAEILAEHPPRVAADKLIEAANAAGGRDNITATVIRRRSAHAAPVLPLPLLLVALLVLLAGGGIAWAAFQQENPMAATSGDTTTPTVAVATPVLSFEAPLDATELTVPTPERANLPGPAVVIPSLVPPTRPLPPPQP